MKLIPELLMNIADENKKMSRILLNISFFF